MHQCLKPSAWMVKAPIGSILPLCHSRQDAERVAEKLTSESRIVPLYEYDEWSEIKKAGAENDRLRSEIARLRLTDAERVAVEEAADTSDVAAEFYSGRDEARAGAAAQHAATLRGLLDRNGSE